MKILLSFLALFSSVSLAASTVNTPNLSMEKSILELEQTLLQFSCDQEDFKIRKLFYEKPKQLQLSIIDHDGKLVEETTSPFQCPSDQITLSEHCVEVQCVKVVSLTPEEAMAKEGINVSNQVYFGDSGHNILDTVSSQNH